MQTDLSAVLEQIICSIELSRATTVCIHKHKSVWKGECNVIFGQLSRPFLEEKRPKITKKMQIHQLVYNTSTTTCIKLPKWDLVYENLKKKDGGFPFKEMQMCCGCQLRAKPEFLYSGQFVHSKQTQTMFLCIINDLSFTHTRSHIL